MRIIFLAVLMIFLTAVGCKKDSAQSKIPIIKFLSLYPEAVRAGSNDIVELRFNFSDGDADLGNFGTDSLKDIYIKDSRVDSIEYTFYFPDFEDEFLDPERGISGICILPFPVKEIELRPGHTTSDTLQLQIFIRDQAGNKSNTIATADIYLAP